MPAKNIIKVYDENGFYHVYNRGVEKRKIFLDDQDYSVFLSYMKSYLLPLDVDEKAVFPSRRIKNYSEDVGLLCYCLMPNHFHFLIRQHSATAIVGFMRSLLTRYSMYFNKKYQRVGSLFQGRYKAVTVSSESQLIYLSRYIHRNPRSTSSSRTDLEVFFGYRYSSLQNYLGKLNQKWVRHELISNLFSVSNINLSYLSFVSDTKVSDGNDDLLIDLDGV